MRVSSLLAALTLVGIATAAAIPDIVGHNSSVLPTSFPTSIISPLSGLHTHSPPSNATIGPSQIGISHPTHSLPSGASVIIPGAKSGFPTPFPSASITIPPFEPASLLSSHAYHSSHPAPSGVRPSHNSSTAHAHSHGSPSNLSIPLEPTASTA